MINKNELINVIKLILNERGKSITKEKLIIRTLEKYDLSLELIRDIELIRYVRNNESISVKYRNDLVFLNNYYYKVQGIYIPSIEIYEKKNTTWINVLSFIFNEVKKELISKNLKRNYEWIRKVNKLK